MKNKKLLTNILFAVVILAIAAVLLVVRRVHASGSGLRAELIYGDNNTTMNLPLDVAAIVAFGQGVKTTKRLRVNILSMSNVDIAAQRQYFAPKHGLHDMVFMDTWGNSQGVDEYIGFYNDMLWEDFRMAHYDRCVRLPMRAAARSLNLSNSVAILTYEALRQTGFPGLCGVGEMAEQAL